MKNQEAAPRDARTIALVAGGGALGSIGRYLLAFAFPEASLRMLPPSMLINIFGSFAVGLVAEVIIGLRPKSTALRLFLSSGFMGGFTTLAAVTPETMKLFEEEDYPRAVLYAFMSIFLASLAAFGGSHIARRLSRGRPRSE